MFNEREKLILQVLLKNNELKKSNLLLKEVPTLHKRLF